MKKRLLSLAAAAALLIVITPGPEVRAAAAKLPMLKADTSDIVEVRKGKRSFRKFGRRGHFHKRRYFHRHHRRHRHFRRWRGPRFSIYIGEPRCSWLRRRALLTGSRYWWRRYYRCRYWW